MLKKQLEKATNSQGWTEPKCLEKYYDYFDPNIIWNLLEISKNHNSKGDCIKFIVDYFGISPQYSSAKCSWGVVKAFLNEFSSDDLSYLVETIESNSQIYDLREIKDIVNEIKIYASQQGADVSIDKTNFPNIFRKLNA